MKTAQEIMSELPNFIGTDGYTKISIFPLLATDGVTWLVENAGCGWLMDEIGAAQTALKKSEYADMLQDMQFWTLTVKDQQADLVCEADTGMAWWCGGWERD